MPLEHVNYTVADPDKTAAILCDIFGWKIRWAGSAISGGRSVHVGEDDSYVALYTPPGKLSDPTDNYTQMGGMNHIGVVVDDIEAIEKKVAQAGFTPHNHGDYEPGLRFYFDGPDGIEYEVVSYS